MLSKSSQESLCSHPKENVCAWFTFITATNIQSPYTNMKPLGFLFKMMNSACDKRNLSNVDTKD